MRIWWLVANLAIETSRAAEAAVRDPFHWYHERHSSLTTHQHKRKQDSTDRRQRDVGHEFDKTQQVKYPKTNPLAVLWGVILSCKALYSTTSLGGNTQALNCFSLGAPVEYGDNMIRH